MSEYKTKMAWYNFRTKSCDYLPKTPKDFTDYIPQSDESIGLYRKYLKMGYSPIEAATKVFNAHLPKNDLTPTPPPATI